MISLTASPTPNVADVATSAQRRLEAHGFDALYGYALAQAEADPGKAPLRSAMLQDPASLKPVRQDCGKRKPLVLIDLDPKSARFDPSAATHADAALAEVLAVLRSRKVAVGWISALDAAEEPQVRAQLALSGLDPSGKDALLLTSASAPTKQILREALASTACPIAIAGDEPADFDELFSYLKTPDSALALNEMFGAGWFLTPLPID